MRVRLVMPIVFSCVALSACGGNAVTQSSAPSSLVPSRVRTTRDTATRPQPSPLPRFSVYVSGTAPGLAANAKLGDIVIGVDGNAWFADGRPGAPAIGRITRAGTITEFSAGLPPSANPRSIAVGPDARLWFTDPATHAIGAVTLRGAITEFTSGLSASDAPAGLTVGANKLWFVSRGSAPFIGMVQPDGRIVEIAHLPSTMSADGSIVWSGDGNLWFTCRDTTTSMESLAAYNVLRGTLAAFPTGLQGVRDPSGTVTAPKTMQVSRAAFGERGYDVWFTNLYYSTPLYNGPHAIGESSASGALEQFIPPPSSEYISGVALGIAGTLWFAGEDPLFAKSALVEMSPSHAFSVFEMPFGTEPLALATALDGTIWMTAGTGPQSAIVKVSFGPLKR